MNANVNKTNNRKLLAAIAVFAMVACVFAVATPVAAADEDTTDTTFDGTYAAGPAIRGDVSAIMTDPAQLSFLNQDKAEYVFNKPSEVSLTNSKLGNSNLDMVKVDNNTVNITGTLQIQNAGSAFKQTGAPEEFDYGFIFNIADLNQNGDKMWGFGTDEAPHYIYYVNAAGEWKQTIQTADTSVQLVYVNSERDSTTYYLSTSELDSEAVAIASDAVKKLTVTWDFVLDEEPVIPVGGSNIEVTSETITDAIKEAGADASKPVTITIAEASIKSLPENFNGTIEIDSSASFANGFGFTLSVGENTTYTFEALSFESGTALTVNQTGGAEVVLKSDFDAKNVTISYGSIAVGGTELQGSIDVNGEFDITAAKDQDGATTGAGAFTINAAPGSVITVDADLDINGTGLTINNDGADNAEADPVNVLILDGKTVTIADASTFTIGADVRVNNYGAVNGGTVYVEKDGTFYSSTAVNTTFDGDGTIDLGDAMETLQISDKLASSAVLKPTQNVLVNGNLTIRAGEYLVVTGSLEVAEGVTVTIDEGGLLMVNGPAASATINGTIISKGAYNGVEIKGYATAGAAGFSYENGKSIDITGTVNAKKATNEIDASVSIKGESNITGTVTIDNKAVAVFGEATIAAGGVLNINGTYTGDILNQGTVNLNGSVGADATVYMNSTDAVLNVTALKAGTITVSDEKLYLQTEDDGTRINVDAEGANVITLSNVKGITITEGYTYTTEDDGTRIVHNNLYVAGTLAVQDSRAENYDAVIAVTNGTLTVSGELTIGKVAVDIQSKMNVTGTVYVTENDETGCEFEGAGELTVTGLVRTVEDIVGSVERINAVKYEQTIDNIPYYFYTSLAAAIESGVENLEVLGNLIILEDTTIPDGVSVIADEGYVQVGNEDITDITLTIADGGYLETSTVYVYATMMVENTDDGIDCTSIISDVSSTTETTAKYTNIYTALNQAQSGETVTITKSATDGGVVTLIRDVEIKDGVTLVVPAVNTLQIAEGVTLTNNGTLDVMGSVKAVDGDDQEADATFGTETVDDNGKEYAVIVNNGTIVSVSKMNYKVASGISYYIPGAYYTINGKFYITPVEDAATQIGNTETDSIIIYGKNTVGTVAFVGTVEEPVKVIIDATAEITADSMTVTNGTIVANATAELNGTYGGSSGTVVLANMKAGTNGLTIEDKAVTVSEQTSQVTYVFGKLDVITSNDSVATEAANKQIVSSVAFEGAVTVQKTLNIVMSDITGADNEDTVTVNGTLTIAGTDAQVDVDNVPMVIGGNVIIDNAGELVGDVSVLGNLDVKGKTDKTAAGTTNIGILMVGAADYKYGTDVAASVSGAFSAQKVFVFSKAVLDDAAAAVVGDATVKSTEFYVEDSLWMTAYIIAGNQPLTTAETDYDYYFKPTDLTDSKFSAWQYEQDGKLNNVPASKNIGDYDKVYAAIDYEIYTVTVFADPGIDAVYVDGKLMTKGYYQEPVNGQWTQGFKLNVAAGEHEITYKLGNYFSGEATMTVNGTAVTGNAFTTSGTDPEDTQVTIYLQGIEASAPETPSGSSDDGMGLTDYLLIVLVVLIVIMAIMVALRLMRS